MTFPRYEQYKNSGVDWLGEFPAHWRLKPLWTLFRRTKRIGRAGEELLSVYREYGVIPKSSRDDNNNNPSEDLALYQLVVPGDLAINKMKAWQGSRNGQTCSSLTGRTSGLPISVILGAVSPQPLELLCCRQFPIPRSL